MCPVRKTVFAGEEKGIGDRIRVSMPCLSSEAAGGNRHLHGGRTPAGQEADGPDVLMGIRGTCEQGDCTHQYVDQDCGTVVPVFPRHLFLVRFGGPGLIMQIEESIMVKAKYHWGHQLGEPQRLVFEIYDPVKKEGYMQLVQHRDADTLLPIIRQYVPVCTEIWSDEWPAYRGLSAMGNTHWTVIHSRNFKDLVTGVYTNHVEAYWNAKRTCMRCRASARAGFQRVQALC